jgi:hypothetical protein
MPRNFKLSDRALRCRFSGNWTFSYRAYEVLAHALRVALQFQPLLNFYLPRPL